MTVCGFCNGTGTINGAPNNATKDKNGNKTVAHGGGSIVVQQCQSCRGLGYYN